MTVSDFKDEVGNVFVLQCITFIQKAFNHDDTEPTRIKNASFPQESQIMAISRFVTLSVGRGVFLDVCLRGAHSTNVVH